ncbi:Crp/Fnr family transcriptional regulator [Actinomadura terrae]|uniref:Crp/Fnr family transcriptional regulator n=1 Tax=Actinomadura terrae TaxID=604353 RepID=UPI002342D89B|nr:Crp/Fnr family transcriptional regulator [Actinomadura terrae]
MPHIQKAPHPAGGWPSRSLLGQLKPETKDHLLSLGGLRQIAAGEHIIMKGATAPLDVFVLLEGITKVTVDTENGKSILLSIRAGGDMVGELAVLDGSPRLAQVTTIRPCVVRRISGPQFLAFLDGRPDAWRAINRMVAARLRAATWHRVEYGSLRVPVRVARILMVLARTYGEPCGDGILIPIHLTRSELGGLIGAEEPTVQKTLAGLLRSGVNGKKGQKIVIRDWPGLCAAAGIDEIPPEYGVA